MSYCPEQRSPGALTLSSGQIAFLSSPRIMKNINGLVGIIVLANGLTLLKVKNIKMIHMPPSNLLLRHWSLFLVECQQENRNSSNRGIRISDGLNVG